MGDKVPEALFAYLIWILIWLCWAYIPCCQTLVGVLVFLNCVCACSSKWMGEGVNQDTGICMPVHVEARGQPGVSFIRHHASGTTHPVFVSSLVVWLVSLLRLGLSLACVSMIAFTGCWDTQWSPPSASLGWQVHLSAGITRVSVSTPDLFAGVLGIKLKLWSSHWLSMLFTNWAVSQYSKTSLLNLKYSLNGTKYKNEINLQVKRFRLFDD